MNEKIRACPPKFSKAKFRRAHIFVSGNVQGVFFRQETKEKAQEIKIQGWVRNLADDNVEMILEGEKEKVEEIIEWIKTGPSLAKVNDIEIKWEKYIGEFNNFEVK